MKLNKDKCHLLVSDISIKMLGLKWGIKKCGKKHKTLLGMEIGISLHFDDAISLYKKARRKLAVLSSSFNKII